jgi:hypothetical protein
VRSLDRTTVDKKLQSKSKFEICFCTGDTFDPAQKIKKSRIVAWPITQHSKNMFRAAKESLFLAGAGYASISGFIGFCWAYARILERVDPHQEIPQYWSKYPHRELIYRVGGIPWIAARGFVEGCTFPTVFVYKAIVAELNDERH